MLVAQVVARSCHCYRRIDSVGIAVGRSGRGRGIAGGECRPGGGVPGPGFRHRRAGGHAGHAGMVHRLLRGAVGVGHSHTGHSRHVVPFRHRSGRLCRLAGRATRHVHAGHCRHIVTRVRIGRGSRTLRRGLAWGCGRCPRCGARPWPCGRLGGSARRGFRGWLGSGLAGGGLRRRFLRRWHLHARHVRMIHRLRSDRCGERERRSHCEKEKLHAASPRGRTVTTCIIPACM